MSLQFDTTKVGGLRWLRLGRLSVAVCISREFRPFGMGGSPARVEARAQAAVARIRARLQRREQTLALARACALVFACVVVAGIPLVLGGVI